MNTSNHRNSRSDNESINSETMENKDPAINQHQTDSSGDGYTNDHTFDSDDNLKKDNDPDRRTLDEYKADQAEPDEDEEE